MVWYRFVLEKSSHNRWERVDGYKNGVWLYGTIYDSLSEVRDVRAIFPQDSHFPVDVTSVHLHM